MLVPVDLQVDYSAGSKPPRSAWINADEAQTSSRHICILDADEAQTSHASHPHTRSIG